MNHDIGTPQVRKASDQYTLFLDLDQNRAETVMKSIGIKDLNKSPSTPSLSLRMENEIDTNRSL